MPQDQHCTYAEVNRFGEVENRAVVDDSDEGHAFAKDMGWVGPIDDLDPEPQIGWSYDGRTFRPREDEPDT